MKEPAVNESNLSEIIPPPISSAYGPEDADEDIAQAQERMPLEDDEVEKSSS